MRFGITALDWPTVLGQLSSGGLFDLSKFDFAEIVRMNHEHGFSLLELTFDIGYVIPGALSEQQVSKLLALKEELNLAYTVHLPLWSIEPSSPNPFIRDASVACHIDAVRRAEPLDPEVYVVHNAGWIGAEFGEFDIGGEDQPMISMIMGNLAEQSIRELIQQTNVPSRKFALESIEFPFEITWKIAETLDTSICLDTGHVLSGQSGATDVIEFVDRYHSRLLEIHLHDGDQRKLEGRRFPYYDHRVLGDGDLPTKEFLTALEDRGFDGPIIFELNRTDALQSLKVIRKLLPNLTIES
jgi:sugar phosphate isomerase/epimerase